MEYVVSVLINSRIFHWSFCEGEIFEIPNTSRKKVILPDLKHRLVVTAQNGAIRLSDVSETETEKVFNLRLNYPCLFDVGCRVVLCVTEKLNCEAVAWLGERFSITLGRKSEGKLGRKNDIVLSELPFVSQSHFEINRNNGRTTIRDLGSTNGTFVNGKQIHETELHRGDVISILSANILYEVDYLRFGNTGAEPMLADCLNWDERKENSSAELFKRSPRIQERIPKGKIEIPAPPQNASKPEINWLSTLLPAGVSTAIAVVMAVGLNNLMMILYTLPMTIAGVFISIVNYRQGSKTYQKSSEERRIAYLKKLDEIKTEIYRNREAQTKAMLLTDPTPEDCLEAVRSRSTSLWCREPNDADFASVRLGTGTVPFSVALDYPQEQIDEEDELKKMPGKIYRANRVIDKMPIKCDVRSSGVVGLLGSPELTKTQLQNMIFHLTTHHCYNEMKIVCFYNEADQDELSWLKDLPHTHGASMKESYLASTQEEADVLFRLFTELLRQRKQEIQDNNSYGNDPLFVPFILFVFFEPKLLKRADQINQYLFMEQGLGVASFMAVKKMAQLPKQCNEIITLSDNGGEIYNTARASERQSFLYDKISISQRRAFARSMHSLYCDEGIEANCFPKNYTLYEMLGINTIAEFDIGGSWKTSDILTSDFAPSAPIGILENGEPAFFNSPPTGDNGGAHAIVAGTTGSGKSETLLTLLISLALRYPPDEVGFLVIDFKGDSIAGQLAGLPHVRGVITNLDGTELRRSLVSIGAENKKRLRLFKEYNEKHPEEKKKVSDIRDYMKKYRQGKVTDPLPHMFIIVDEFAEMKRQLPDIMEQFLSVAQIGRSLGVHLILATQSPSGVVDNKIRANIFKQVCLKVANAGESRDMIGTDMAAKIKDPGRGYLKTDDVSQLFQSAYGGGKISFSDGSESTQIHEAIEAVVAYCDQHSIRKLPDVFCPALPTCIVYPNPNAEDSTDRQFGFLPIGIKDDPENQVMDEYNVDVFSRNTIIVGSQLTGKTNLLQTILQDIGRMYSPEEVNIYILDFASLFLKNYETLPHVGGVVTMQDTEKIKNLFRLLNKQVDLRRRKLLELGVSTFAAYRESGARDLPQILLLVDDLAAVKAYFPVDEDPLLALCKEGLTLGISVVATTAQAVGGLSYLPTFANRIALFNNDTTVYSTLLGHTGIRPKEYPGRSLVSWENKVFECQTYLAFDSEREIDRAKAIRVFCQEQTEKASGKRATLIPFVPNDLSVEKALSSYPEAFENGQIMFGFDYATVAPISAKLTALGMLALSGQEKGVRNFQRYLLTSTEKTNADKVEFYIIDGIERKLQPYTGYSCVKGYEFLPERASQMMRLIEKKAEERYIRVTNGDISILDTSPTLVLILNGNEAINIISSDKSALEAWLAFMERFRRMNVCTIFGDLDNMSIPYGSEILKKYKDDRKLVFFEDLSNLKIGDLPYSTIKKFAGTYRSGDGYLILGNEAIRIRVPDCPLSDDV